MSENTNPLFETEQKLLAALRELITFEVQNAVNAAVSIESKFTAPETPVAPAPKAEAPAAPAPKAEAQETEAQETEVTNDGVIVPSAEQESGEDRPFAIVRKRMTKLEKQYKDIAESENPEPELLKAAHTAFLNAEAKKIRLHIKRLETQLKKEPNKRRLISLEIGFSNIELDEIEAKLANVEESILTTEAEAPETEAPQTEAQETETPATPAPAPKKANVAPPPPKAKQVAKEIVRVDLPMLTDAGHTYEIMIDAGWSDEQLVASGYIKFEEVEVEIEAPATETNKAPAPPVATESEAEAQAKPPQPDADELVSDEEYRTRMSSYYGTAALSNRLDELNKVLSDCGVTDIGLAVGDQRVQILESMSELFEG